MLLIASALLAFLPAVWCGYIWDDDTLLTANPLVKAHGAHGLVAIWRGVDSRDYTPLTISAFWLEWRIWGDNPAGYHIVNLLLHAVAVLLLWRIFLALRIPGAWLGAFLFAIHPINAASAAWIAELKNTLSAVFFLGSILAFLHAYIQRDRRWIVGSVLLFLLAGLSKGAVVTLPLVLAGCLFWMYGKITRGDVFRLLPFFVIAGVVAALTIHYQGRAQNYHIIPGSYLFRIARAGQAVWWYLGAIFFPAGISPIAPQWNFDLHSPLAYLPALGVLALLTLFYINRRTWGRSLFFAGSYYLWMLLPVLGFVWMALQQETPAADWWQYLAAPGIFACVAAGYTLATSNAVRGVRLFLQGALGAAIVLLFFQSWERSMSYENMGTYCAGVLGEAPHAWTLETNYGVVLKKQKDYTPSIGWCRQAIADNPNYAEAHYALANSLTAIGGLPEAETQYRIALGFRPEDPQFLSGLAGDLYLEGKTDEAFLTQRHAIFRSPSDPGLYTQFGNMLMDAKQYPQAADCFDHALQLAPTDMHKRIDLIRALVAGGKRDKAEALSRPLIEAAKSSGDQKLAQSIASLLDQTPPQ
ncbi:MAG TPA: hypothetical protein VG733_01180 [Chthoniobacteraceae bacterium]|nr:hypothetical protein [Chthoniobacteraceae bacterium]